jgi:hypothetical protein
MEKPDPYEHNESSIVPTQPRKANLEEIYEGVEHELPKGYFLSPLFIGTYVVSVDITMKVASTDAVSRQWGLV